MILYCAIARRELEVVQEKLKLNLSTEFVKLLLDDILKFYTDLNKANELKEVLPEIFQSTSKEEAEKLWTALYKLASESNVEEITKFAETQNENYKDVITNAGIYHIGISVLEGINNEIKVIKRVAFGSRDFDYFFLRIMDAFRGKPAFA